MEQIRLETVLRRLENNEGIGHSQHGFSKGKLFLANLMVSYSRVTVLVCKERATGIVCLDL